MVAFQHLCSANRTNSRTQKEVCWTKRKSKCPDKVSDITELLWPVCEPKIKIYHVEDQRSEAEETQLYAHNQDAQCNVYCVCP